MRCVEAPGDLNAPFLDGFGGRFRSDGGPFG